LISRRNKKRAGTRYHTRGSDKEGNLGVQFSLIFKGNVAAYVETEQIMQYYSDVPNQPPTTTSFVQTRGSIPLYWKQDINLAYEPPIEIGNFICNFQK
jgi:hypothetical protein